jgi:hypothetical protein
VVSSLYARLPAVKDRLDLSDGQLSLALLGLTAGLLLAQPLTGAIVARRGSAPATVLGAVLCAALVVPPTLAGSLGLLVLSCVGLGYANGTLDVAMNVQGVSVERAVGRPILSGLHAAFSIGMLAAGALAVVTPPLRTLAAVAALALVVTFVAAPGLARGDAAPGDPAFARPSRALAALAAIAFAALLCEGAIADWSAVHLHDTLGASKALAPLGLTAFALAMTFARLIGDRFSPPLAAAGTLAAASLIAAALAPSSFVAITGFTTAGLALATLFPRVVRNAGSAPNIAAVSTAGYVGLVAGPPLIGGVAEATSLRVALAAILGAMGVAIVGLSR